MRRTVLTVLSLLIMVALVVTGCARPTPTPVPKQEATVAPDAGGSADPGAAYRGSHARLPATEAAPTAATQGKASDFKVGMVTDVGGIDDKTFNATSWQG